MAAENNALLQHALDLTFYGLPSSASVRLDFPIETGAIIPMPRATPSVRLGASYGGGEMAIRGLSIQPRRIEFASRRRFQEAADRVRHRERARHLAAARPHPVRRPVHPWLGAGAGRRAGVDRDFGAAHPLRRGGLLGGAADPGRGRGQAGGEACSGTGSRSRSGPRAVAVLEQAEPEPRSEARAHDGARAAVLDAHAHAGGLSARMPATFL